MRNFILMVVAVLSFTACETGGGGAGAKGAMSTQNDSISYAVGVYLAQQMKNQGISVNPNALHQAFVDNQNNTGMTAEGAARIISLYQLEMQTRKGAPITEDSPLNLSIDSLSMALGADFSDKMKTNEVELNAAAMLDGATEFLSEAGSKFDDAKTQALIGVFSTQVQAKAQEKAAVQGKINLEEGEAFLAENKTKEGVQTTESGLQYKVLTEGTGAKPKATDEVEVHYEGRLINGKVFDSSYQRGQTTSFPLNQVIKGWTEGLQLMKTGAKYQFYIPSNLAYGPQGPPDIGPNSTLIFDVELVSIK